MNWNKHSDLRGTHALFSPSQPSWLRYDDEQIQTRVRNQYRAALGTELHEFVATQILLRHKATNIRSLMSGMENYVFTKYKCLEPDSKLAGYGMVLMRQIGTLPKEVFETAKHYINDGIGYRMQVEQPLVYSEFIFGTADTISFRDGVLRIHDYKSGDGPVHMDQLIIYAALFCLEYLIKPRDIKVELRIYQAGEVVVHEPSSEELEDVMDHIIGTNRYVEKLKAKEE